jgi:hypothetical protein
VPSRRAKGAAIPDGAANDSSMRQSVFRPLLLACTLLAAAVALGAPVGSQALTSPTNKPGPPTVATGGASHVRGSSATLDGIVNPHGLATTYFFQYGPSVAYGSQTKAASLAAGYTRVKVGQAVTGFRNGEHYRLVATNSAGTALGHDRTFGTKAQKLKFAIPHQNKDEPPITYGAPFVLRASMVGPGSANHRIILQESPYPYLTSFEEVGLPTTTDAAGRFTLRTSRLTKSTELRVSTLDPRPHYSPTIKVRVAVRVTLKVRTSARKGLVRLYGTVTPAEVGARVFFQVLKRVRPGGRSERETKFASQFSSKVKRGTSTISRFSYVATIKRAGRYRAYVQLLKGPLVSGASRTVRLSAALTTTHSKK